MNGKVRKADLKAYRACEPVFYKLLHGGQLTAEDLVVLRARPDFLAGPDYGQFWTPPHLAASIVHLLNIQRTDRVLEPGCGWGSFVEPLAETGATVVGVEFSWDLCLAARALWADRSNVTVHHAHLYQAYLNGGWGPVAHAALADETYDLVVGNPPYGLTLSADEADGDPPRTGTTPSEAAFMEIALRELKPGDRHAATDGDPLQERLTCTTRAGTALSEVAFLEIALRVLKPGGWLALILPAAVYGNHEGESWGRAAAKIRPLLAQYDVQHVIRLPEQTFAPATTMLTDVWIVCKRPGPGPYRVSKVASIGLDHRGQRTCAGPDDLTDMASAYRLDRDGSATIVVAEPRPASPVVAADAVVELPPAPTQLVLPGMPPSYTQLPIWQWQ